MGDYTNLSVELKVDVSDLPTVGLPCTALGDIAADTPLNEILKIENLCTGANKAIQECLADPSPANCQGLPAGILKAVCEALPAPIPSGCAAIPGLRTGKNKGPKLPNLPAAPNLPSIPGLPNLSGALGLNRAAFNDPGTSPSLKVGGNRATMTIGELMDIYDPALTSLLVSPLVVP